MQSGGVTTYSILVQIALVLAGIAIVSAEYFGGMIGKGWKSLIIWIVIVVAAAILLHFAG